MFRITFLLAIFCYFSFPKVASAQTDGAIAANVTPMLNPNTNVLTIIYDIVDYNPKDFYMVEISFHEYRFGTVTPRAVAIVGANHGDLLRGGKDKMIVWDYSKENRNWLSIGEYQIDVYTINKQKNKVLYDAALKAEKLQKKIDRRKVKGKAPKRRHIKKTGSFKKMSLQESKVQK